MRKMHWAMVGMVVGVIADAINNQLGAVAYFVLAAPIIAIVCWKAYKDEVKKT